MPTIANPNRMKGREGIAEGRMRKVQENIRKTEMEKNAKTQAEQRNIVNAKTLALRNVVSRWAASRPLGKIPAIRQQPQLTLGTGELERAQRLREMAARKFAPLATRTQQLQPVAPRAPSTAFWQLLQRRKIQK